MLELARTWGAPGALAHTLRLLADIRPDRAPAREVAQALYVSTKTVEVPLTSVYRKLGISTRAELEGALAGARNV